VGREQNSLGASQNFTVPTPRKFKSELVLGGSLVSGERVAPEEDLELSRRGTERHLQVYSYFFGPSVADLAWFVMRGREELGWEFRRRVRAMRLARQGRY
jgi:hypothetical protein